MISSQYPILVPVIFLFCALLIPVLGAIHRSLAQLTATLGSALALYFSVAGLQEALIHGRISYHISGWMPPIGIEFVLDPLSAFFCVLLCGITLLAMVYGKASVVFEAPIKEIPFYSLSMLFLGGLSGMALTGDLFNLFVFMEVASLSSYALVAIGDRRAPVSALRYLILGTAGVTFYLLGVAFLFMSTGTLNMADMSQLLPLVQDTTPVIIGMVLIIVGIGLKMALFPMHVWMPDAYTYASSTATALIAAIGTKVAAYVLLRFMFFVVEPDFLRYDLHLIQIVGFLGAIGIIWGSVMAICQHDMQRMLAYSSVSQVGYIALGIGLASPLGFIGAVLHALNHACMKACLFFVNGNLRLRQGHTSIPKMTNSLRSSMPWTSAAFALAAISMIGLPPTAGFFSKWYLVLGAIEQAHWFFLLVLLLSTLLNVAYFFRVLERMYLKPQEAGAIDASTQDIPRNEAPASMLIPTLILAASLLVLGLANAWIVTNFIVPMIPGWL